ncbi:hypothetical protein [Hydrogenophaga sp.]|jgi:hypothetical protein|uniref:hypothetical protein n=1 Tax=Hydrogenophaga sp. TaxID=1904254 RepID=UPI003F704A52
MHAYLGAMLLKKKHALGPGLCAALLCAALTGPVHAAGRMQETLCPGFDQPADSAGEKYQLFFSPYTHHWSYDEEHRQVYALSLSRLLPNDRFCGFSLFNNSFGQPSAYAYIGKTWPGLLPSHPQIYVSATAGIIYGYVGKYKNKVPLNVGGFAPAIIPAIGYRLSPSATVEVQLLGTAAFMLGATWRF